MTKYFSDYRVCTGRVKELMSAPVECYQQLQEFLAPYEELRWLHEIQTKQYHSACSTLITCADIEEQSLSKQKVCAMLSLVIACFLSHPASIG